MTRRRRQLWFGPPLAALLVALAGTFAAAAPPRPRSPGPSRPLQVVATSLTQDGQQLALAGGARRTRSRRLRSPRDGRSLCLLIERARDRPRRRAGCASPAPATARRRPGCIYRGGALARARRGVIDATITRTSADELTASSFRRRIGASLSAAPLAGDQQRSRRRRALPRRRDSELLELFPAKPALVQASHRRSWSAVCPSGPRSSISGPVATSARSRSRSTTGRGTSRRPSAFVNVLERVARARRRSSRSASRSREYDPTARSSGRCSPTGT